MNTLLVSVNLPFTALSLYGLQMNRTDCGNNYLAADKPNSSCTDVPIHELLML